MGQRIGVPRAVSDAHGTEWVVSEWEAGDEAPLWRGRRCLLFQSGSVAWRLWSYPAEWRELPAADLASLGWRT